MCAATRGVPMVSATADFMAVEKERPTAALSTVDPLPAFCDGHIIPTN